MQFAFFETALRAQKSYSRLMEPVCKRWNLTHNELDVLLFLANNPEQNRAADIVRGRIIARSSFRLATPASLKILSSLCIQSAPVINKFDLHRLYHL